MMKINDLNNPQALDAFVMSQAGDLVDFWRRLEAELVYETTIEAFGVPVQVVSNYEALLEGVSYSAQRYSQANPPPEASPIRLTYVLDTQLPEKPVPIDWPARLNYFGIGSWLTINAAPWVHAYADLERFTGVALYSPSIAAKPYLYSRFIGDCFVLNMMMRTGWGQLHASCVVRDQTAILLHAPHNHGKSTTAFRLALNGYRLLSDGMTYVRPGDRGVELLGYPVGEVKLRLDVLESFPMIKDEGSWTVVREDAKMVVDLRKSLPDCVIEDAIRPGKVVVCLLERVTDKASSVVEVDPLVSPEGNLP